jgi:hypothetical protein
MLYVASFCSANAVAEISEYSSAPAFVNEIISSEKRKTADELQPMAVSPGIFFATFCEYFLLF